MKFHAGDVCIVMASGNNGVIVLLRQRSGLVQPAWEIDVVGSSPLYHTVGDRLHIVRSSSDLLHKGIRVAVRELDLQLLFRPLSLDALGA